MNSAKLLGLSSLLVSTVVSLSLFGWSQDATYAQKLYGKWYTYPPGNPSTDPVGHQFLHNSVTGRDEMIVTRHCPAESRIVVAKAVSPIEVSEDTIRVLKSASDSQPTQGSSVCEASVTAGFLSYSFSDEDDHLVLTNPGGNPDFLELARGEQKTLPEIGQRLYGTWLLPAVEGKAMRVQLRWVFYTTAEHQDKLRQIAVCTKGNDSLVSHVDSDVSLSREEIKVLQSASHQEQEGDFICQASIATEAWRYSLSPTGVTLTLYAAGAKPITLTREP